MFEHPLQPADLPTGSIGYDVSWPQCDESLPEPEYFAIIGVTGGKALTENDCLPLEVAWANGAGTAPQAYLNLNELPSAWSSPACLVQDTSCRAYQYGVGAANAAVEFAVNAGAHANTWWLDVETENDWSPDNAQNVSVIRGAFETLQARGLHVGIYSTPLQWEEIAGTYSPGLDVWLAGASSREDAAELCQADSLPFNGGELKYVQFIENDLDNDYAC